MCHTVNGSGASSLPDAPEVELRAPAKGEPGCGGGSPTKFIPAPAPKPEGGGVDQLQALLTHASRVAAWNKNPTSEFETAEAREFPIRFEPFSGGESALRNMERVIHTREARVELLRNAVAQDKERTGSTNPVDLQKLRIEEDLVEQSRGLIQKLSPYASTIDEQDAVAMNELMGEAGAAGAFSPAKLARLVIRIEGDALRIPSSYLASANRGEDFAARIDEQLRVASNSLAAGAQHSGSIDAQQLQGINRLTQQRAELAAKLRANYELAKSDPARAQQQLDAALKGSDIAEILAGLA